MLFATVWIGKVDLNSKKAKSENDDTVVEETVTVPKVTDPSTLGTEMTERKTEV